MTEYIGWLDEDHAPVLDMAQEIVRCRDCKHCDAWDVSSIYGDHEHDVFQCDAAWGSLVRPDGFCAWGERREQ